MKRIPAELETERIRLRRWREADRSAFAAMNADPRVMEHFPAVLAPGQSNATADRIEQHFADHGFGFWAVEVKDTCPFIGFIGLAHTRFQADFTPCIEIAWRLAADHWGNGYAPEGARAAVEFGFRHLGLDAIVSMTAVGNSKSRRVMEKIGMVHCSNEDFDHPLVPDGHHLKRHVLYRLRRPGNGSIGGQALY